MTPDWRHIVERWSSERGITPEEAWPRLQRHKADYELARSQFLVGASERVVFALLDKTCGAEQGGCSRP